MGWASEKGRVSLEAIQGLSRFAGFVENITRAPSLTNFFACNKYLCIRRTHGTTASHPFSLFRSLFLSLSLSRTLSRKLILPWPPSGWAIEGIGRREENRRKETSAYDRRAMVVIVA